MFYTVFQYIVSPFKSSNAQVKGADLVIVSQENKLVCNLWPLFGLRKYKMTFWGHGKNLQGLPTFWGKLKDHFKFITNRRADWWFVYTDLSSQLVEKLGFPKAKITNLQNSIDTTFFKNLCTQVSKDDIATIKQKHVIGDGPQKAMIQKAETQYHWLRYVGRKTDSHKAQYLKTASVFLNSGLVAWAY